MKAYLGISMVIMFVASHTGTISGMTLNEAIAKALAHDPTIAKIHADTEQAEGFAKELRADLLPQISIDASAGAANRDRSIDGLSSGGDTLFSRRAGLVGRQLIWDGGYHSYLMKDANQRAIAKQYLDRAQRELTAWSTVEAYLDLFCARKQLAPARKNVEIHAKVLDLANKRAQAAGNQADIELSSARYNLAVTLVNERELAVKQAEAAFIRFVGEAPGTLRSPRIPEISSLEVINPMNNWHYLAVVKQQEAAELQKKALQRKYYPKLYLDATATRGEDVLGIEGKDNELSALVVASWEIFDGGRRKAQIAQAMADIHRQEAILRETLAILNQDIAARWADYKLIGERMKIIHKYSKQLGSTVSLYQEQFDLGTRPLLSFLDIQNEVSAAEIRLTDEERNHAYLGYRLLYFGGRLIPETVGDEHQQGSMIYAPKAPTKVNVSSVSTPTSATPPPQQKVKRQRRSWFGL